MTTQKANSPVVIVLASGRGERFIAAGGTGSKLRALLAGRLEAGHGCVPAATVPVAAARLRAQLVWPVLLLYGTGKNPTT